MSPELIVHIGTPKTGSSSLQRALFDGAFSAAGVRLAYPERLSEVDLAQALARGREYAVAKRLGHIRAWLSTTDADVFVLSSEHFVTVPAGTFASAVRRHLPGWPDRTRVVCYVRPHAARLVSAFAQQRKSGAFLGPLDEFIQAVERRNGLRYAPRLEAWNDAYGDAFVVRLVSADTLVGGDVVVDFLHLATSGAPVTVRAERLNPSLSVEALALLSVIHRALRRRNLSGGVATRIGKRIAADLSAAGVADHGHRLRLSVAEAETVAEIFAEDAARLDATYFPDANPFAADLRGLAADAHEEAPSLRPADYADPETRTELRRDATALADVCVAHGRSWVAQFRAAKGYRSDPAARGSESAALVEAALEPVVADLIGALRSLP